MAVKGRPECPCGQQLSRTPRGPQRPQSAPFPQPFLAPASPRRPQRAALPCPHPPPPVLAVGQASGGCLVGDPWPELVVRPLPHPGPGPSRRVARGRAAGRERRRSERWWQGPQSWDRRRSLSVSKGGAPPARRPGCGCGCGCGRLCGRLRRRLQRDLTVPAREPPPSAALAPLAPPQPGQTFRPPPRSAGVPAAVIAPAPPAPPFSSRSSSHDPALGGPPGPIPSDPTAQSWEPAGATGEARCEGLWHPPSSMELAESAGGDRVMETTVSRISYL